jgi:hypothetical protein
MRYDKQWNQYRIKLNEPDLVAHRELLNELLQLAYNRRKKG